MREAGIKSRLVSPNAPLSLLQKEP